MPTRTSTPGFFAAPENRSALAAIRNVLDGLTANSDATTVRPLYLHGPSGCGKSCLVKMLKAELDEAGFDVCALSANDFAERDESEHAISADVLVVEDLQHLPTRFMAALTRLIDDRLANGGAIVFTALKAPAQLAHRGAPFPRRLASRLTAGLVVSIEPLQAPSRRRFLEVLAGRQRLTLAPEILDWLAANLTGGGRQLQGAILQLRALQHAQAKPLRLSDIQAHFHAQAPSVKRIVDQVCEFFHVKATHLVSERRSRDVLLPRQVGMYLARRLTNLSLERIGRYFGGRDHKTVQHACAKIESAMRSSSTLSGAVRQLCAALA